MIIVVLCLIYFIYHRSVEAILVEYCSGNHLEIFDDQHCLNVKGPITRDDVGPSSMLEMEPTTTKMFIVSSWC